MEKPVYVHWKNFNPNLKSSNILPNKMWHLQEPPSTLPHSAIDIQTTLLKPLWALVLKVLALGRNNNFKEHTEKKDN
jgi:hypothetical protein